MKYGLALAIVSLLTTWSPCLAGSSPTTIELFSGHPLGVARVHFEVEESSGLPHDEARFTVSGDHSRILYPVFYADAVPATNGGDARSPGGFEILFLFQGEDAFELIVTTNLEKRRFAEFRTSLEPVRKTYADDSRADRNELLSRWWQGYREALERPGRDDLYYPLIENYLLWYLPRSLELAEEELRMDLSTPSGIANRPLADFPEAESLVDILMGTESVRLALQRDALLSESSRGSETTASVALPRPINTPAVRFPEIPRDLEIEPIATVVPAECLYIRFPRYSSFRELGERIEKLGGQLHDLILGRSNDARVRSRLETQLALGQTGLSKLFGDFVIGEMALIANDTFVREGSALGVIFDVKNAPVFRSALANMRRRVQEASRSWSSGPATTRLVDTGAGTVDLLEAPGNRVRSFHAVSGSYHLVTNCLQLARRFLECAGARAEDSLAKDPGFRHARHLHPVAEAEDAFVFISDAFVRQLIGPAYRTEMTRRTRARAELELIEVARQVARAETGRRHDLAGLRQEPYLPSGIFAHADGATYRENAGAVVDTRRGLRGTFLPIPDMQVERLTPPEARAYETFRRSYQQHWARLDPVAIRVRRAVDQSEETESIEIIVDILPFARDPYRFLQGILGPPSAKTLKTPDTELFSLDLSLRHALPSLAEPDWARFGVLDFDMPLLFDADRLVTDNLVSMSPYYLILPMKKRPDSERIECFLGSSVPTADGSYEFGTDFWENPLHGHPAGDYVVLSPEPRLAKRIAKSMAFDETSPAQARLRLDSVRHSRLERFVSVSRELRIRRTSESAAQFLTRLHRDLKVPIENVAAVAESVLGARIVCPAGGTYRAELFPPGGGLHFNSDAFRYPAPGLAEFVRQTHRDGDALLDLFRGFDVGLSLSEQSLHSEIKLRVRPQASD